MSLNVFRNKFSAGGGSDEVKTDVLTRLCNSNTLLINMTNCYPDGIERLCRVIKQQKISEISKILMQQTKEGKNVLHVVLGSCPEKLDAILILLDKLDQQTILTLFTQQTNVTQISDDRNSIYCIFNVLHAALPNLEALEKLITFLKGKMSQEQLSEIYACKSTIQNQETTILQALMSQTTNEEEKIEVIINAIAECLATAPAHRQCVLDALQTDKTAPYARHKTLLNMLDQTAFTNKNRGGVYSAQFRYAIFYNSSLSKPYRVPLYLYRSIQLPVTEQADVFKIFTAGTDINNCLEDFKKNHLQDKPFSTLCFYTLQLASMAQEFKDLADKATGEKQQKYTAIYQSLNTVHKNITTALTNASTGLIFNADTLKKEMQVAILLARDASKEHRKPLLDFLFNIVKALTVVGAIHMGYRWIVNYASGYGGHFHKTHRAIELEKLHDLVGKFDGSNINDIINKEAGYTPKEQEVLAFRTGI